MLLRAPEFPIDPADPFASDVLDRLDFAGGLTELVKSVDSAFVLNLEAGWGQGKTTFLHMWRQYLKNRGMPSLYFNAWETDFSRDPLVSFIGELTASMHELVGGDSQRASQQLARVREVGLKVIRRAVPAAVKLVTAGLLDLSDVTESILSEVGEKIAEDQLKAYEDGKSSINGFRNELAKFAGSLIEGGSGPPLVVIVDELDRCRPDYAIRTLEVIKHLFNVTGIFFVVATDTRQLANAVRHTYGLDTAAGDYLRRFFDVTMMLPDANGRKFVEFQLRRFGIADFLSGRSQSEFGYDISQIEASFYNLFQSTSCTLRDQEKCFGLLSLAMRSTPDNGYLHPLLLCSLIILRLKDVELYHRYVGNRCPASDAIEFFKKSQAGRQFFASDRGYSSVIEAYFIAARESRHSDGDFKLPYQSIVDDENSGEIVRSRARRVLDLLDSYEFRRSFGVLASVAKKLDLVSPFAVEPD
jgi:hypothetical protein